MYCPYINLECYNGVNCTNCSAFINYHKQIDSIIYPPYPYKCSCGGEFNYPTTKCNINSTGATICTSHCPFCNKVMEGL